MSMKFAGAVLGAVLTALSTRGSANEAAIPSMTFDDLFSAGITGFVDKEFILQAPVTWQTPTVKVPEDPRATSELAALAGPLKVSIEGKVQVSTAGHDRLLVVSDKLRKVKGADGVEQWSFNGRNLARDAKYALHVRLLLRASFKKDLLGNPAFVRQSNDPKYWSQTFELELLGVDDAGKTATPDVSR